MEVLPADDTRVIPEQKSRRLHLCSYVHQHLLNPGIIPLSQTFVDSIKLPSRSVHTVTILDMKTHTLSTDSVREMLDGYGRPRDVGVVKS